LDKYGDKPENSKKQIYKTKESCIDIDETRFWLWETPLLNKGSESRSVRESLSSGLSNGFLLLKDPAEETTPMVPGWKIAEKAFSTLYSNTWVLHPLDNGDPILKDSTDPTQYQSNNFGDYMTKLLMEEYGVYGDRSPIEKIERDLLRGVSTRVNNQGVQEISGIRGYHTHCEVSKLPLLCTGGSYEWRQSPFIIGSSMKKNFIMNTKRETPSEYDIMLVDPVFGNGGGMSLLNSDVGHHKVIVKENVAAVGGGINLINTRLVPMKKLLKKLGKKFLVMKKILELKK
jgi:hypothetical protein